jgi:lipid-binding SYLF domain-containing protein
MCTPARRQESTAPAAGLPALIGFQLGAQEKAVILLFMDGKALDAFRKSDG